MPKFKPARQVSPVPAIARATRRLLDRVLTRPASSDDSQAVATGRPAAIPRAADISGSELLGPRVAKFPTPPPAPRDNWLRAHQIIAASVVQSGRLSAVERAVLRDLARRCPPRFTEQQRVGLAQAAAKLGINR
jgi:hypothetical protein